MYRDALRAAAEIFGRFPRRARRSASARKMADPRAWRSTPRRLADTRGATLTRPRRIRVRPETGRQLRRVGEAVPGRAGARGAPSAGRGVAGFAGPPPFSKL